MQYRVDRAEGQNPHVNYEPSIMGGLTEAKQDGKDHTPHVEGDVKREVIVDVRVLSFCPIDPILHLPAFLVGGDMLFRRVDRELQVICADAVPLGI